jgi:hypothetical protein
MIISFTYFSTLKYPIQPLSYQTLTLFTYCLQLFFNLGIDPYQCGSVHSAIISGEKAIALILDNVNEMLDDDDEDCEWTTVE